MTEKSQHSNIMLAFFTLAAVIVIVSIIGFFTLGKGPEIIQGQAEATEYRVSSKVPGRILKFLVDEGEKVKVGDTLAILEAPDVQAKWSMGTGYFAINEKAYETDDMKAYLKENPNFETAINQLKDSPVNANTGIHLWD